MEAIRVENVTLDYILRGNKRVRALNNISLTVNEGEFVTLLGHNGSGKSSFAKVLNGLLIPHKGNVEIFGISTRDENKIFEIRKNIGMVFQNPDNQMIASIVEDDIAFGPENLGLPREEIIRRVDWALTKVGMLEHKKSTPFKMSGGQKQRLAIAGILAIKPRILILDESTAMLDPKGRDEVLKVAHDLNKNEKITVIHITHYMDEAINSDRVLIMNSGEFVADGVPQDIFAKNDLLNRAHLTLPIINKICLGLKKTGLPINDGIMTKEALVDDLCRLLK